MKIKICGITHPDDAQHAAEEGADYIGIIFSRQSKRVVTIKQAKEILTVANNYPITPVAVFLEQSFDDIKTIADNLQIDTIQIHGVHSTDEILRLSKLYTVFYAVSDNLDDSILPYDRTIPLYDNHTPGSGHTFDWKSFNPPSSPWVLAGGLNCHNIDTAMQLFNPHIVDVASGVEYQESNRKNPLLIKELIRKIRKRTENAITT